MSTPNELAKTTEQPKSQLETIKSGLMSQGAISLFKDNLPNAMGKQAEEMAKRFAKMTYTAICQNPTLQGCTVNSIVKAASIAASLDLDIDTRGLAYLVPFRNNKANTTEAQFQIGYMGLIELAYRSGKVKAISAHCIYESEKDAVKISRIDGQFSVEHPFSYTPPTGKMIAVYATAEIDGLGSQTTVLRADEVEKFRKISKAPNSPAWANHYEAMCKKTAIRQLAKFLPKSILEDFSRGAAIDEKETFVEAEAAAVEHIDQSAGSKPIDAAFEENTGTENTEQSKQPQEPQDDTPPQKMAYYCSACDIEFATPKLKKCPNCGATTYVKQY
ncbi:MAG: recombinase RecT [Candidatus Micrarchaeia archaeon]|jgi:recombination protein RecT